MGAGGAICTRFFCELLVFVFVLVLAAAASVGSFRDELGGLGAGWRGGGFEVGRANEDILTWSCLYRVVERYLRLFGLNINIGKTAYLSR